MNNLEYIDRSGRVLSEAMRNYFREVSWKWVYDSVWFGAKRAGSGSSSGPKQQPKRGRIDPLSRDFRTLTSLRPTFPNTSLLTRFHLAFTDETIFTTRSLGPYHLESYLNDLAATWYPHSNIAARGLRSHWSPSIQHPSVPVRIFCTSKNKTQTHSKI